ncbi:MAG: hypothetical protein ACK4GL_09785 [Flavobacteriales bacterium]
MNRRKFIKTGAAATAGAFTLPYILPSGRLFAATGSQLAEHVVYVLFAGGVRQQESILQRYLADSQGEPYEGNLMHNMLNGPSPSQKIVFGTNQGGGAEGGTPIPKILNQTLQTQGTLFREVRSGSTGHYGGLNQLLQGSMVTTQGLKQKPVNPTIFEYIRRHGGYPASKVWFVGNGINNSVPLLNHSSHPDYGARFGANFFAPGITFGQLGQMHLANAKAYHPEYELDPVYKMKLFLDNSFDRMGTGLDALGNTDEEKYNIKQFMNSVFTRVQQQAIPFPGVNDTNDTRTVGFACELLRWFKPNLTVINMNDVDGCHSNFTSYLRALHRADHAVGHLWNFIQTQVPEMAGNTIIIAMPECGRNLNHNPIRDQNDWFAYDHSDANAERVFGIMAGPNVPSNLSIGSENNPIGLTSDGVPTISEILGVKQEVLSSGFLQGGSQSLFDRI